MVHLNMAMPSISSPSGEHTTFFLRHTDSSSHRSFCEPALFITHHNAGTAFSHTALPPCDFGCCPRCLPICCFLSTVFIRLHYFSAEFLPFLWLALGSRIFKLVLEPVPVIQNPSCSTLIFLKCCGWPLFQCLPRGWR